MNKDSNPSIYPTFSLEIQHCFPKASESHALLVADLPQLANSPLTNGGPGKMPVGDVQGTSLSE